MLKKNTLNKAPLAAKKIDFLRGQIDQLDTQLITLLKKRFKIVRQIGELKKEMNLPIFQKSRWTKLLRDRIKLTQEADGKKVISSLFIRDLFTLIHSESLDLQEKLKKSIKKPKRKIVKKSENKLDLEKNSLLHSMKTVKHLQ